MSSVSGQSYIELDQEGKKSFFYTEEKILKNALEKEGILVDERDRVTPSFEAEIKSGINNVSLIKARPVIVHNGDEIIFSKSAYLSAEEIVKDLGIGIYSEDKIKVADPLDSVVFVAEIFIDRAPVINLQIDGQQKQIHTRVHKVSDIINAENIVLGVNDRVEPNLNTLLTNGMNVSVVRVSQSENNQTIDIPFSVEYKNDSSMLVGQSKIERYGVLGKKQISHNTVVENGVVVSKSIVSEVVVSQPVSQVVIKGTKPKINYASGAYADLLNAAAQKYGVDAAKMSRLMYCESKGNPYAVGGGGKFFGLFQYSSGTWSGASAGAGFAGASIYDAEAQIYTTAWKISVQGYRAWPTCGSR